MRRALRRALGVTAALTVFAVMPAVVQARAAPAPRTLTLELPLRVDAVGLARFAAAVSTPGSARYGRYASVPWLSGHFGASAATRARVLTWLHRAGATGVRIDATGLFADATLPVAAAERRFGTALHRFRVGASARGPAEDFLAPLGGTRSARVPAALRGAVTGVVGLDTRALAQPSALTGTGAPTSAPAPPPAPAPAPAPAPSSGYPTRSGTPSGCAPALAGPGFTPDEYLTAYGYQPLQAAGLTGQGERVALVEIDGFAPADVRAFAACFGLPTPDVRAYGVGITRPLAPGGEATLDLELLDATAPSLTEVDVYESQPMASDVLRALTDPLSIRNRKPDVISASLGTCEADVRAAIGAAGIQTVEQTLELAAATGVSVLAASGDAGSTGCLGAKGKPLDDLAVDFPASSPWVTGVGGTNLTLSPANTILDPATDQVVWNDEPTLPDATGGGVSMFPRPGYQNGFDPSALREVPDVAMLADPLPGYEIYCTATVDCVSHAQPNPWISFGGTSAATPLLAGGLALVDEDLRLHGREDLGFLNPLLYGAARSPATAAATLSDVVTGSNNLSEPLFGHELGCCTARPGYDEAAGLGSVNLTGLAAFALTRVPARVTVGLRLPTQRRPLAAQRLLATVSCSSECLMGAYAQIRLGASRKPIVAYSSTYELTVRRSRTIPIPLGAPERTEIDAALAHHERVMATVYGAVIDVSGQIERQTAGEELPIKG